MIGSYLILILFSILLKWVKALLMVIHLEAFSVLLISLMLLSGGGTNLTFMLILLFFVSEALIMLSSFFSCLRVMGKSSSSLVMN